MRGRVLLLASLLLFATIAAVAPMAGAALGATIKVTHRIDVARDFTQATTVTVTYDTCHYRATWTWSVPDDARDVRVRDDNGPLAFTRDPNDPGRLSFTTSYGNCKGDRAFVVAFRPADLDPVAPPFYRGQESTVGSATFDTRFVLTLPDTLALVRANPPLTRTAEGYEARTTLPQVMRYVVEAPKAAGIVDFTVAPWRFLAPEAIAADLRDVAVRSKEFVDAFDGSVGFPSPYSTYLVAVEPGTEFSWEIGRAVGDGLVVLNHDAFRSAIERGKTVSAVEGLVHETFHAHTSDALSWSRVLTWWKEGTAVAAEHQVEAGNGPEVAGCALHESGATCYVNSSRITLESLLAFYESGRTFPFHAWTPEASQDADARRFGYAYTGFVVGAYVQRYGEGAYRAVWQALAARASEEQSRCAPCDNDALESLLLANAPGATLEDVLYPWRGLYRSDEARFRETVRDLVAPPFPTPREEGGDNPLDPNATPAPPGGGDDGSLRRVTPTGPSRHPLPAVAALPALAAVAVAAVVAGRRRG